MWHLTMASIVVGLRGIMEEEYWYTVENYPNESFLDGKYKWSLKWILLTLWKRLKEKYKLNISYTPNNLLEITSSSNSLTTIPKSIALTINLPLNIVSYLLSNLLYSYILNIKSVSKLMHPIDIIFHIESSHFSSESYKAIILLQKGQTR